MLLQAQSVVLECTPAVYSDPDIQAGLSQVEATLGWQGHQLIFDLAAQWPMHRRRWWCSLCPSSWSFPPLAPWPTSSSTTKVSSIFESWGLWSEDHEADLQLTRAELAAYGNPAFGSDRRLATLDDTMPTVLHSFGCALQALLCLHYRPKDFEASWSFPKLIYSLVFCTQLSCRLCSPFLRINIGSHSRDSRFVCLDSPLHHCKRCGCTLIKRM